ncbi:hypothetical protein V6N13_051949 [Hibiscus sabdariffa]
MLVEDVEVVVLLEVVDVGVELMLSRTLLVFPILRLPLSVFSKLERAGGPYLEAPKNTISEWLLTAGASFLDGVSEAAPNLDELWLDHTDRVLDELDYSAYQRLRAYTALLKDQAYNWWGTVQRNTPADQLTS